MTDNTINNDLTMGGGANGTLLAGRYRVVRQLGQGGMGSVWLAEDLKLDGHKVAVKMLPSILVSNKRAYNQLKSEALVALKLTHPNIATVRAFEENEGNPFLVMDYIDGLTLDEYLAKKGKLSEETTYCLLEPVARALDYAHERGIVHRDVKPGNVMVTWDGDPFVLDFGIAREIQETMTRVTGKLSSGTLLYMSPEQLRGASPKPAQDVYSFAALAYECLKGEPPFSRGQVEWQILNGAPEPLPADIAMGPRVMAGLAKKPEDRPPNCLAIMRGGWNPADGGGTHAEKPKSEAEETTSAPRAEAPKAVAPATEAESPLVAQIRERWKLLALVGVSLLTVIALVSSRSTASSPSGRSAPAGAVEAGDESKPEAKPKGIDAKYVDVGVLVGRVERLDRADGFAAKIDALVDVQNRARSHYELQKWTAAAKLFDEAETAAKELLELGRLREQAKSAAHRAERAANGAEAANAKQLAATLWNQAVEERDRAKGKFGTQRFTDAVENYGRAERLFADAEMAAKSEGAWRENKAREDALRKQAIKEICDLRSACEQSRWQAEKAGASEFAAREMATARQLLADADMASEDNRKQAYQIAQKAFEHARQIAMEAAKPTLFPAASLAGAKKRKLELDVRMPEVKTQLDENSKRTKEQDIERRMKEMRLPTVSFKPPATIIDAVDFFRSASKDYDRPEIPIEKRGFNFILKMPQALAAQMQAGGEADLAVIPMIAMSDISFYEALTSVCDSVGYKFIISGSVVWVMPKDMDYLDAQ